MLIAKKGMFHRRIFEYRVFDIEENGIEDTTKEAFIEWTCMDTLTQMRTVSVPDSEDLVIILCTDGNKIIFIPIKAIPSQ